MKPMKLVRYAIFRVDGRQYKASEGDEILVEGRYAGAGKVEFENVLLINEDGKVNVGVPHVAKGRIVAEVLDQVKGKKLQVRKYRAKSRYRRTIGHRPKFLRVKIQKIITS